jgi:folate-binding Fe-S cluster repair protein YgfZ
VGKIPLETNVDMLNGVSFRKGCYLGQEMVARSHFKGQIRKRIVPVSVLGDDVAADAVVEINGAKAGKLLATRDGMGLALLKFATFVNEDGSFAESRASALDVGVRGSESKLQLAGFPEWWDTSLTQPAPVG